MSVYLHTQPYLPPKTHQSQHVYQDEMKEKENFGAGGGLVFSRTTLYDTHPSLSIQITPSRLRQITDIIITQTHSHKDECALKQLAKMKLPSHTRWRNRSNEMQRADWIESSYVCLCLLIVNINRKRVIDKIEYYFLYELEQFFGRFWKLTICWVVEVRRRPHVQFIVCNAFRSMCLHSGVSFLRCIFVYTT